MLPRKMLPYSEESAPKKMLTYCEIDAPIKCSHIMRRVTNKKMLTYSEEVPPKKKLPYSEESVPLRKSSHILKRVPPRPPRKSSYLVQCVKCHMHIEANT